MVRDYAEDPGRWDELISSWHEAKPGEPGHGLQLHEFLGMTWEEYVKFMRPKPIGTSWKQHLDPGGDS